MHGEQDSALQYLQESLKGRQEHLDDMHPDIAETQQKLGHIYCKRNEWDNAVDAFSDCLKIRESNRTSDMASQILVADSLFDLGTALNKTSDTKRSMQLFSDALKEYQRHLSKYD